MEICNNSKFHSNNNNNNLKQAKKIFKKVKILTF